MSNLFGHFRTITAHKLRVMKYCFKAGLYRQGLLHDMSKYAPIEFLAGVRYYQGTRSPNEIERLEKGYSAAWLHHKGRNRHHLEYWIDYAPELGYQMGGMEIPVNYVVEMFCDRLAASRTYKKEDYTDRSPLEYYLKGKGHYVMHPDAERLLYRLLLMLSQHGERYTFRYIRRNVL